MAFKRDWACPKCGTKTFDVPTSVEKRDCVLCGTPMKKVVSAPMVMFNGDGWTPKYHGKEK